MTAPPRTVDADTAPPKTGKLHGLILFAAVFAVVLFLHLPLINLPYYWDEAGYFIPAARDIYTDGAFIPHSTLSNAHPPLVMAYLALAWKIFGDGIATARVAMLLISTLTLLGVFRLSERVANNRVAWATLLCTALYPVFFAQSSLAHLDMTVAALTIWGLVFYLPLGAARDDGERDAGSRAGENKTGDADEYAGAAKPFAPHRWYARRRWLSNILFALAALAKETAILTPLTLFAWESLCFLLLAWRKSEKASALCLRARDEGFWSSILLLLALAPLALWFAYHRYRTGYTFGNPEYFRYNVESTFNLSRVFEALWGRVKHVTFHMNLYVLTLAALVAMFFKARRDGDRQVARRRINVPVQLVFAVLILAHVVALSVVGGAVIARYMLPVFPLVVLICVSTIWRRARHWWLIIALVCASFAFRNVVNPAYSFPWEENLAYRDFVVLHADAAHFISANYTQPRVLTTWPASDELKNPYFGYLDRPLEVVTVENLKRESLQQAARRKSEYDVALLFSTHGGLTLEESAELLGGRIVFREEREGQWVAVLETGER